MGHKVRTEGGRVDEMPTHHTGSLKLTLDDPVSVLNLNGIK